jgi:PAS domain S-box-containing protein
MKETGMREMPAPTPSRPLQLTVAALFAYAFIVSAALARHWGGPSIQWFMTYWYPLPPQLAVTVLVVIKLRRMPADLGRLAWRLMLGAVVGDLCGLVMLNFWPTDPAPYLIGPDIVFFLSLGSGLAAIVAMFLHLGGSFRSWRTWLDAAVLATGFGAIAWAYLLGPMIAAASPNSQITVVAAYSCSEGLVIVLLGLLVAQLPDWRMMSATVLLVAAQSCIVIADFGWLTLRINDGADADSWLSISCYCAAYALLGAGAVTLNSGTERRTMLESSSGGAAGFAPVLMVSLAMAGVIGVDSSPYGVRKALLVGALVCGMTVFAARQFAAHRELRRLYRSLAQSEAEARLTELLRRSPDVFAVTDTAGVLTYVSPAASSVLGVAPEELLRSPASAILGPDHQERLDAFLEEVRPGRRGSAQLELAITSSDRARRIVCMLASDQRANPAINGLALTLRDVTEQRRLEEDLMAVTAREQERLSSEIHEGLGQDLIGISLMIKSLEKESRTNGARLKDSIEEIGLQIQRTIDAARTVAIGLAPLQVAGGSLEFALRNLASRTQTTFGIRVDLRIELGSAHIGASEADHVYRIVRESVNNATRHSGCSAIEIDLCANHGKLALTVSDNGAGHAHDTTFGCGMGLRMISYRARMMGGELRLETPTRGGSRVVVTKRL